MRLELWSSFRSLLQSYLAAASMGSEVPLAGVLSPAEGQIQVVGASRSVALYFRAETGIGKWELHGGSEAGETLIDEGVFRLHLNGELEWSGKAGLIPMDQVAEALAMLVVGTSD